MVKVGDKVLVLYPEYAAGKVGIVLAQEVLQGGENTGYWLVQIEESDEILALKPSELKVLTKAQDTF